MSIGVLINHTITFLTSPMAMSMTLIIIGTFLGYRGRRKVALACIAVALTGLWFMSCGLTYQWLGMSLERSFPPQRVEELPKADAIVILGGGITGNTNTCPYAELFLAADRVVHAARIWKAGKAPMVIVSGFNEEFASCPFLQELGVPRSAIMVENLSGNTEENARFVAKYVSKVNAADPSVLLVTSSWHMRRALLMFRKYASGIKVTPAACDYEATVNSDRPFEFSNLAPNADMLWHNSAMLKEIIGYWGYRLLR